MTFRKRVLLVDLARSYGGAESRVRAQARFMHTLGIACDVAVLAGSSLQHQLETDDLPCVPLTRGRGNPLLMVELVRMMRAGRYDVVDAHNVQSIFWGMWAAAVARVPCRVATIHSDYAAEYPGAKGKLYAGVLRLTQPVTRHTITVTEQLHEQAAGRGAPATHIPNAVPVPPEAQIGRSYAFDQEWGFAQDDFVVGIVGRLVPVKGHRTLIDALALLNDLPHVKLIVVGAGKLEDDLRGHVQQHNLTERVRFLGFRDDVPQIMQAIDCLCVPSLSEALPYVVLEAASFARPLVATNVGGLQTLLTDQETALLVPSADAPALAAALRKLAGDAALAQHLGQSAYNMVATKFSVERMMRDVLGVYAG